MRVEIVKRADGGGVLRCTRADGSVTWQKQGRHAAHFALHDLTHFAVESTLGFRQAFFGLIAAGWEIEDTSGKGTRGSLPPEAIEAERIVGLLDSERASGAIMTAEEMRDYYQVHGEPLRALSDQDLQRIRTRRSELFAEWRAVPAGEAIELQFPMNAS